MSAPLVSGSPLPNIPWEDRPAGCHHVIWRSQRNPIIPRDLLPDSNSIFNSAVVPFRGAFAGVFRVDNTQRQMLLHAGRSPDGLRWEIEPRPLSLQADPAHLRVQEIQPLRYGYDPRVCWIEDRFYVTWCNEYHGPTIGVAWTRDFHEFFQLENAFLPYNRNGVLFPEKVNGKYLMLSRPSDTGHTPFGDIYCSESPDLIHWGCHRFVMARGGGWSWTKIGPGPTPLRTREGWLLLYHGVLTSCNGFVYNMGAALLDLAQPWKVLKRAKPYLLSPQAVYECVGDTPNVVFPVATLCDPATNRLAIYYGAADTVVCLAFAKVDELVAWVKEHA